MDSEQEVPLSNEGETLVLILPRISALVSLLAVICVFLEARQELRASFRSAGHSNTIIRSSAASQNIHTVHYIQYFYQIPLFCFSLANALGTLPAPRFLGIWGAAGTVGTCTAQGLVIQFGLMGIFGWDAALSFTYLAMAKTWNVSSWKYRYHFILWPVVVLATVFPFLKDMYNFNYNACWIHEYPNKCRGDQCLRGEGAAFWATLISFVGLLHLIYSMTVMACLYRLIRKLENQTQLPGSTSDASHRWSLSRAILTQGILYASGMVLTTLPTAINVVVFNTTGLWSEGMGTFAMTMTPLVGYVNFVVYMRKKKPEDCHTQYGKRLRQAHSWWFDYNLVCHCRCECLPHRNQQGDKEEGWTNPTTTPAPPNNQDDPWHHHEPEIASSTTPPAATWSGFLIQIKHKTSQWMSDLGESSIGTDHWVDLPPSKPRRMKSEASMPPSPPIRILTEQASESDDLDDSDKAYVGGALPPSMPVRFKSSVLESHVEEDEDEDDHSLSYSRAGEIAPSLDKDEPKFASGSDPQQAPPVKPMRYLSDVEMPDA